MVDPRRDMLPSAVPSPTLGQRSGVEPKAVPQQQPLHHAPLTFKEVVELSVGSRMGVELSRGSRECPETTTHPPHARRHHQPCTSTLPRSVDGASAVKHVPSGTVSTSSPTPPTAPPTAERVVNPNVGCSVVVRAVECPRTTRADVLIGHEPPRVDPGPGDTGKRDRDIMHHSSGLHHTTTHNMNAPTHPPFDAPSVCTAQQLQTQLLSDNYKSSQNPASQTRIPTRRQGTQVPPHSHGDMGIMPSSRLPPTHMTSQPQLHGTASAQPAIPATATTTVKSIVHEPYAEIRLGNQEQEQHEAAAGAKEPTVRVCLRHQLPAFANRPTRQYAQSVRQQAALQAWTEQCIKDGIIERSDDIECFSPHFVHWEQGGTKPRVVGDFTTLNNAASGEDDSTRNVLEVRAWAANKAFVGKVDLSAAFHNVVVDEASKKYFGFVVAGEQYRYRRLPMGWKNGPAVFARWITYKLRNEFGDDVDSWLANYQDDIFVGADSAQERDDMIRQVLAWCVHNNLRVNASKIERSDSVNGIMVLGIQLQGGRLRVPPAKAEGIRRSLQTIIAAGHLTKRQVYKICGRINYFSHLAHKVAAHLTYLYETVKTKGWNDTLHLDDQHRRDLQHIHDNIANWSVAVMTDANDILEMFTDASATGWGCVMYTTKTSEPVYYYSGQWPATTTTSTAHSTTIELRAILHATQKAAQFLRGHQHYQLRVMTDNIAIPTIMTKGTTVKANQLLADRIHAQMEEVMHKPVQYMFVAGVCNPADAPSRAPQSEDKNYLHCGADNLNNSGARLQDDQRSHDITKGPSPTKPEARKSQGQQVKEKNTYANRAQDPRVEEPGRHQATREKLPVARQELENAQPCPKK